ncbi:uncharacterized protein LOC129794338 [Lutzomyia longipalpis]|uniref:uncharacterized protein LOC129794338 n=1 Tax=Lutzomyia longipalpis TaxID=7200 RepID=UPI00248341D7|nr:uncharacterized protein LOC129794338 [Lutzomyia longipalpis]
MWKKFLVIVLVAVAQANDDKKKFKVTLEKVDVEADPAFATVTAAIRNENGGTVVDISGNILQDIDSDVFVDIFVSTEGDPGEFKPLLKAEDIDFCAFDKNNTMAPLLDMFLKDINNYGSIPLKCPVKKGDIHLKGYNIAHENLPSLTPEARYLIESKIFVKMDGKDRHEIYHSKWIALIAKE